MKNAFGKLILLYLVIGSVCVFADDEPTPTPYLNETSECGGPMGFIDCVSSDVIAYIVGVESPGVFLARGAWMKSLGVPSASCGRVQWYNGSWNFGAISCSLVSVNSCQQDFLDYVENLIDEEPLNMQAAYKGYFTPPRYDMTADDDGDGRLDYYDLDCPRYEEYLAYCEASNLEPLDLLDYQYFQDNEIVDWLTGRLDMTDTDGDGFSDHYEIVHGSDVYDGSDYPLGVPDTGDSLLVVGGVNEQEPWRLEEYNDSGYSRGYVYDKGYDPFGDAALTFEDNPDWGLLDSDNDGLLNYAEHANGTNPYRFEFQSGFSYAYDEEGGFYYVTGYTEDGAFGDYGNAPTEEEWLASHEDYQIGDYTYNPSEYSFGDTEYDGLLSKTDKIKFDCDNVRPQAQRDFKLTFNIPIPGVGLQGFTVAVVPDVSTPAGAALEVVRQLVRGMAGVIFSYIFIKNVWLTIRQY